jgi:hypothetical protein
MAKKKKKQLTLLLLILVMVGLSVAYVALTKHNADKKAKDAAADEATSISKIDKSKVVQIMFTNKSGTMTLVKENNTWKNEADPDFPVNQTYVDTMLSTMGEIKATKTVLENSKNLGEYGLDKPSLVAEVTLENKTTEKITLGRTVPVDGGYYALVGDKKTVYAVEDAYYTSFQYSPNQMIQMETAPTITTDNITHLTVYNGKNGKNFEAVYNTDGKSQSDYFLWDIKQPFQKTVSGDPSKISTLLSNYGAFTFNECADYHCKDVSKYGLGKDAKYIDLAYYEESKAKGDSTSDNSSTSSDSSKEQKTIKTGKTYKLYIGSTNKDGNYYVQPEGSKAVYVMSSDSVDKMLKINAFDYVNKYVFTDGIEDITEIDMNVQGASYQITAQKTDTKNSKTSNAATFTYKINGKDMKSETYQAAFQKLAGVVLTGESKNNVKDSTPYLTMTVKTAAKEKTVEFLPYDGVNFYLVSSDGVKYFLVDKPSVDEMVDSFTK